MARNGLDGAMSGTVSRPMPVGPGRSKTGGWRSLSPEQQGNILRAAAVLGFFTAWQFLSLRYHPVLLPGPLEVARGLAAIVKSGELPKAFFQSLKILLWGFSLAVVLGTILGFVMGRYKVWERILDPFISSLYSVPKAAFVPLIIIWLGLGITAKISMVFLQSIFPVIVTTYTGVRNTDKVLVEVGRAFGVSERQLFRLVLFPWALSHVVAGIRLAAGRSVIGVVVAEFFLGADGIGALIRSYAEGFSTPELLGAVLALVVVGYSLVEFAKWLERRMAPWRLASARDG